MKRTLLILSLSILGFSATAQQHDHGQHSQASEPAKTGKSLSPHTSAMAMIGDAHVHIDYSSPSVRGRMIFGGLVGYNHVWQAGAHMATWIETNKPLVFGEKTLPAGKYGFFTIPGKQTWKVMFNSKWEQHGKDEYDEKNDVLVLEVKPEELHSSQEELTYEVKKLDENRGEISLSWEKIKINLPFKVKE